MGNRLFVGARVIAMCVRELTPLMNALLLSLVSLRICGEGVGCKRAGGDAR